LISRCKKSDIIYGSSYNFQHIEANITSYAK